MKSNKTSRFVCKGGALSSIAVLLQAAPIFVPGIGLILSPLSTLPVAIAAISDISLGIFVFFSSTIILTMISIQETLIFLFTTGILGVVIGSLLYRKGIIASIICSSMVLTLGMIFLTYLVKVEGFIQLTNKLTSPIVLLIYIGFTTVYTSIWNIILIKLKNTLMSTNV